MLYKKIYENQLEIHYQPQINALINKLTGIEALTRWKTPEGNYIPPSKFIPIAEKTGLIIKLGNWIIEESMKKNSIKYGIEPGDLEFKVTENVIMDKYKYAMDMLDEFSSMRIGIVIDNFGIEYSCMKYLKTLPVSKIKIDREFVLGIGDGDEAIIKAILSLASYFNFGVIAEGVETEEQVAFLIENNCNIIQVYLYSKPIPTKELESFILSKTNSIHLISQL